MIAAPLAFVALAIAEMVMALLALQHGLDSFKNYLDRRRKSATN